VVADSITFSKSSKNKGYDLWIACALFIRIGLLAFKAAMAPIIAIRWSLCESISVPVISPPVMCISSSIRSILRSRCTDDESSGYVFPGVGKTGHIVEPKKAWVRVLEKSKIRDLRMHDLRHVFGSYLAAIGANQFVIRDALGHKDISSSSRYVQNSDEVIMASIEKSTNVLIKDAGDLIPNVIPIDKKTRKRKK